MTDVAAKTDMIECKIDGALCHSIERHLRTNHPTVSIADYQAKYPGAPLLSEKARRLIAESNHKKEQAKIMEANEEASGIERRTLAEVFDLPLDKTMNSRGDAPVTIKVVRRDRVEEHNVPYLEEVDKQYVFQIDATKAILMALAMNEPILLWGMHGTGKTSLLEQICARTNRPFHRVQHTINTEEAHIVGQYIVKDGETVFNLGPLPIAMLNGHLYCADEYDFALPAVTSVYQPVLEGKPLVIKDAPPEYRVIRPHPNFRFAATGNTNGGGDETGLYQGTQMQNAANYSRFGLTIEIPYMDEKIESAVIAQKSGVKLDDAKKLVRLATEVRKSFKNGQFSATISPRELIKAAKFGFMLGGKWNEGLQYAFANRLSPTDGEVFKQLSQRVLGHAG